jgi:hypothetical protein
MGATRRNHEHLRAQARLFVMASARSGRGQGRSSVIPFLLSPGAGADLRRTRLIYRRALREQRCW